MIPSFLTQRWAKGRSAKGGGLPCKGKNNGAREQPGIVHPKGAGRAEPEWAEDCGGLGGGQPLWRGGEQGALCDSWPYNVGIVPSLHYIWSPKGGGQRRTKVGASARALCAAHPEERGSLPRRPTRKPTCPRLEKQRKSTDALCHGPLAAPVSLILSLISVIAYHAVLCLLL